ncbi:hypothetical protein NJC38_16415 [Pseudomonas sp. 21LCFQ010]|uniref:hypothetical protein n=1 Tax=Pseudomonas sp. 21LCFQ010 TaxID=2957506 RepID=UPI0020970689|nr:hypothetical protein [Pseudomonas sp. 21LCFQ010]MCO8163739.1 hypothetical protein [Pseudomonas sp. 21LCFQ010]
MNPTAFLSGRLTPKALSMWIVVFICLVCVSLLLATLWQVKQSADERLANARSAVFNIVRAAEQHATDTVRQADSTLKNIAERIEVDGWGGAAAAASFATDGPQRGGRGGRAGAVHL